jgi:protein NrfD
MPAPNMEIAMSRHNPGIDPVLGVWSWEVPGYLFLGGLVAGLLVFVALLELGRRDRPRSPVLAYVPFGAAVLLSLGMFLLFLDLDLKLHVYRFYLAFKPASPMSWGSWILVGVYPLALLEGFGMLGPSTRDRIRQAGGRLAPWIDRGFAWLDAQFRLILVATIAAGAALGVYTGLLLGTLAARPLWDSALLGPLFLTSGLSTGAATLLLLPLQEHEKERLARWDVAAIAVEMALIALLFVGFATSGATGQQALSLLWGGPYTAAFWSLVVVSGLGVPLALELLGIWRKIHVAAIASVLVLAGGMALRVILVNAGLFSSFRLIGS